MVFGPVRKQQRGIWAQVRPFLSHKFGAGPHARSRSRAVIAGANWPRGILFVNARKTIRAERAPTPERNRETRARIPLRCMQHWHRRAGRAAAFFSIQRRYADRAFVSLWLPTYTQSAAMNTRDAANSKADANLPLAAAREAKKNGIRRAAAWWSGVLFRLYATLMARAEMSNGGGNFFILKLHREADPPARFAKATCGLSARRVLGKRPRIPTLSLRPFWVTRFLYFRPKM